ncbi:MAG: hypothetical protein ABIZ95_17135 [Pyrinomonadaceae bacterium]
MSNAGDNENADKFIAAAWVALEELGWWASGLPEFARILVNTHHDGEVDLILSHLDGDDTKPKFVLVAAVTYSKLGNRERALSLLQELDELEESDPSPRKPVDIADAYLRANERDRARSVMKRFEAEITANADEGMRDQALMLMIPFYFRLGDDKKSFELWYQVADSSDRYMIFNFVQILVEAGKRTEANSYLSQLQSDRQFVANERDAIAEAYLKLDQVDDAARIARNMGINDDDGKQQRALMMLADRYLKDGRNADALATLNFAWQKARRVAETHRQQDSNGASPLTRKIHYLGQISDRYVVLKRNDLALSALRSFTSNHEFALDFIAFGLVSLAEKQVGTLSRSGLFKLLDQAASIANEKGFEGHRDEIMMRIAEGYAQMGESTKALAVINQVLKYRIENTPSAIEELIAVGLIMESNKLKADPELRKILAALVIESDSVNPAKTN